jgi:hypothetical protein
MSAEPSATSSFELAMTRSRLFDLLQRAATLSAGQRLILAGSQAIYAFASDAPLLVERSEEADLLLVGVDCKLKRQLRDWRRDDLAHLVHPETHH